MKKRSKFIASILAILISLSVILPSAALARGPRHYRGGRHHYYGRNYYRGGPRYYRSGHRWYKGLALYAGLRGIDYLFQNRVYSYPVTLNTVYTTPVVFDYELYKQNFVNSLDAHELAIYAELANLSPGNYRYHYRENVNMRRLKKICTKLYEDYSFNGLQDGCALFTKKK